MNDNILSLLRETRKILLYHQTLGIDEYPATTFASKSFPAPGNEFSASITLPSKPEPGQSEHKIYNQPSLDTPVTTLPDIKAELGECRRCSLADRRHCLVFGEGNEKAELMIIGGWPGREADQCGSLFRGDAGEMLRNMLKAIGLTPEEVFTTTLVKCRPADDAPPGRESIHACLPFLERQIRAVDPTIIWIMGTESVQALLKTTKSILQLRGRFHDLMGIPAMPTFHPEFLLRNPELKKPTWLDLQAIQKRLHAGAKKQ